MSAELFPHVYRVPPQRLPETDGADAPPPRSHFDEGGAEETVCARANARPPSPLFDEGSAEETVCAASHDCHEPPSLSARLAARRQARAIARANFNRRLSL